MSEILNISAYRFVALDDPASWQTSIRAEASILGLKGTVLLAGEGINLFVAGDPASVERFVAWLHAHEPFAAMEIKRSRSTSLPFGKLLVKVKPEIIRMNQSAVQPQAGRAPSVDGRTLARWLAAGQDDAGRPVVTLDTRNAFEVAHGRFEGALDWKLERFSDFPAALAAHRGELDGKTVVSYCTGGIRCEKAALWMAEMGVDNVLQLDGGILKYLAETDGAYFEGNCFVFDARETLDRALTPTPMKQTR